MKSLSTIVLLLAVFPCWNAVAGDTPDAGRIVRVGGNYTVTSIERTKDGVFVVEFTADQQSGKFDKLTLESDHIHFAVKEGEHLRLSAEIESTSGSHAMVSQVLLFLPGPSGAVPVWMLSRRGSQRDLRGAKYLEMHNPQSDYSVF